MKKIFAIITAIIISCEITGAQNTIVKEFKSTCDSLNTLMTGRTNVNGNLILKSVMKRSGRLDFYFTESLGDYPLRKGDTQWLSKTLKSLLPEKYRKYDIGIIYSRNVDTKDLEVLPIGFNGNPLKSESRKNAPTGDSRFVTRKDTIDFSKGLEGRNIAIWHSHGYYYDKNSDKWIWQRPNLFQTVEDMFTQSFVLPYLAPMLENAGAYVMMPRERDTQRNEVVTDNDPTNGGRGRFEYKEYGNWETIGTGFADAQEVYLDYDNPFTMGTAVKTECTDKEKKESYIVWRPEIPEDGEYAVYVSYASLPESTSAAEYIIAHDGDETSMIVNQKMGGSTWIYLGTYPFKQGNDGYVKLTNMIPQGYPQEKNAVVTADAVRFGGGMGNIARREKESEKEPVISGMPRYAEGARYWLQWAGTDKEIYSPNELEDDYKDDFMSRGDWVEWISRGSHMNPSKKGMGIPVDLSLGFHSDAGVTPNDSIVGTLAIYTYKSENETKLPCKESRMTSREFADIVQSQIVHDIRKEFNPEWGRRHLWDRGYRESRTPSCPSMLLELLSHQNFGDMKYGLDPNFRFTVSRSVYKGMLKYLSNRYMVPYVVQPLPVQGLGVQFCDRNKAVLTWKKTDDPLEPTADATGFILYKRIGDGSFDNGTVIESAVSIGDKYSVEIEIERGEIYSFMIEAYNEGGKSFPSEIVSIGIPKNADMNKKVLIVNNFDRVSGPAFFDTPEYAGFDNRLDSGVPYMKDIAYIGDMYEFRRNKEWVTNINAGFGSSYSDYAGKTVAGNTFDYPYIHGKAVMAAGYAFYSCSNETFCEDRNYADDAWCLDLICGKQVTTVIGNESNGTSYTVFTEEMQKAITDFTEDGGHVLVSGSNIATDIWDQVYYYEKDAAFEKASKNFAKKVLGYNYISNFASRNGAVSYVAGEDDEEQIRVDAGLNGYFHNTPNEVSYCVETPDGIEPSNKKGRVIMKYADTDIPAAICYEGNGYRTVCIGFPIETYVDTENINAIISTTLDYFRK